MIKLLSTKDNVKILGLRPEMIIGYVIVANAYLRYGYDCIITSTVDGVHSRGSRHYLGCAIDFRTRHIPSAKVKADMAREISDSLPNDFDVVLEKNHLHVEFDPKF